MAPNCRLAGKKYLLSAIRKFSALPEEQLDTMEWTEETGNLRGSAEWAHWSNETAGKWGNNRSVSEILGV